MSQGVTALIGNSKFAEGLARHDELLAFVEDRELEDPDLRKAMTDAKAARERAKREIEERRLAAEGRDSEQRLAAEQRRKDKDDIVRVNQCEVQAKSFAKSGELARAVEKYEQALGIISANSGSNPFFIEASGRVSDLKRVAANQLAILREKRARDSADRTAREKALAAAKLKLVAYYKGGHASVLRRLAMARKAADHSLHKDNPDWLVGSFKAVEELLKAEKNRVRDIPFFTKEEKRLLGTVYTDFQQVDTALATRVKCSTGLYIYANALLTFSLQSANAGSKSSGQIAELLEIAKRAKEYASDYLDTATFQHRITLNLLEQGTIKGCLDELRAKNLGSKPEDISAEFNKRFAALTAKANAIAKLPKPFPGPGSEVLAVAHRIGLRKLSTEASGRAKYHRFRVPGTLSGNIVVFINPDDSVQALSFSSGFSGINMKDVNLTFVKMWKMLAELGYSEQESKKIDKSFAAARSEVANALDAARGRTVGSLVSTKHASVRGIRWECEVMTKGEVGRMGISAFFATRSSNPQGNRRKSSPEQHQPRVPEKRVVVCSRCDGTGRKTDRELRMEMSARSAGSVGTGTGVTRVRIDPRCPKCNGTGRITR